jgi:hypothetical protein
MRTVAVMSLLQTLQMYLTPPPEALASVRGADLALVMRPMFTEVVACERRYESQVVEKEDPKVE